MFHMDTHRERLLRLATEARENRGLEKQTDLVKAANLSRSTVHRFERGEVVSETALRRISQAIGWTPNSAQEVLAGGDPTLAEAEDIATARYEIEDDPNAPEDVGMIVRNTVIEVVGVLAPNTPLSEVQEIEAQALAAVLRRGGRPRQRHQQAYQDTGAVDPASE